MQETRPLLPVNFEELKRMHSDGMTYEKMAEVLNTLGYRTPRNQLLTDVDVSRFMRSHGYRVRRPFSRGATKPKAADSDKIEKARLLLNSNLPDQLKQEFLWTILK